MSKRHNAIATEVVSDAAAGEVVRVGDAAGRPRGVVLPNLPRSAVARGKAGPFAPACATFRRHLKNQGLKFTPERAMVLDAVLAEEGLFDAERVIDNLKSQGHRGSRATVYRTLGHLADAGLLRQVFFGNGQTYYEVVVPGESKDYLVCVETGRVVGFQSERLRELRDEICREFGFDPVGHQLHVFGVSPEGRASTQRGEDRQREHRDAAGGGPVTRGE